MALERLGYDVDDIKAIADYIDQHETIEGCDTLNKEHVGIFDCAFKLTAIRATMVRSMLLFTTKFILLFFKN